ncbi:nucleoside triphosphate pyrophosphohydrolase [Halorubrum sp. AD140]|uniref:nucleoside triphosphate pyrophosphohydrolase n=1 Tax=Halorubrum sp. AD140 TaxID=3050073 RepID=UPI002ACCCEC8|nr:nucleoside triphosphate pyrophosphohydrolase [Halorubrum sp. AD140]MDZ5810783.1 nucleoside triphosphate pyrophosphohydrolase [Halorubrum sp. AD140]
MTEEFDKLVRDEIPRIIEENGETPITHTVEGDEYSERLDEKLAEEVTEYLDSGEVEELADVLEVLHAIRKERGVSLESLRDKRRRKAEQRGRFDEGIVLERVEK